MNKTEQIQAVVHWPEDASQQAKENFIQCFMECALQRWGECSLSEEEKYKCLQHWESIWTEHANQIASSHFAQAHRD